MAIAYNFKAYQQPEIMKILCIMAFVIFIIFSIAAIIMPIYWCCCNKSKNERVNEEKEKAVSESQPLIN